MSDSTMPRTSPTIEAQLSHRTIRAFAPGPLPSEVLDRLLDVARQTSTSSFRQQTTVIHVSDPGVREQIRQASTQPYVGGTAGELFVFVADLYRNARIREEAGLDAAPLETLDAFLQGYQDSVLATQNVVVAAESLGLGAVILGSIANHMRLVIDALQLPARTFPALGLIVGVPAQEPQLKPRLPREITIGENAYPPYARPERASEPLTERLADYDARVTQYYDLREADRRIDSFTRQIRERIGAPAFERAQLLEVLHEQRLALR